MTIRLPMVLDVQHSGHADARSRRRGRDVRIVAAEISCSLDYVTFQFRLGHNICPSRTVLRRLL
jgi:hypothetical protein